MIEITPRSLRTWSMLGPCGAFGTAIQGLMDDGEDFSVLTADLRTYSGLDRFSHAYPDRLINVGIAEQNMVGVASGMAKEGARVFATTYATFASTRSLDQVRVGMSYMKLPVVLVGLTSGISVGILGATHMSTEDIAIMRTLPNITILSPSDGLEVIKATEAALRADCPVYLRLPGGTNCDIVYHEDYRFEIGKAITLCEGEDIVIVATGSMVAKALAVRTLLEEELQASIKVINMHTIKPLDKESIKESLSEKCRLMVSVEEHSTTGGLGDAILGVISESTSKPCQASFLKIGLRDGFPQAAPYLQLLETCGLSINAISESIIARWKQLDA